MKLFGVTLTARKMRASKNFAIKKCFSAILAAFDDGLKQIFVLRCSAAAPAAASLDCSELIVAPLLRQFF